MYVVIEPLPDEYYIILCCRHADFDPIAHIMNDFHVHARCMKILYSWHHTSKQFSKMLANVQYTFNILM